MINFEKQTWYNKNDTENEAKRIPISAFHLNRIEDAISSTVDYINDMGNHWWRRSKIVDVVVEFPEQLDSGASNLYCFSNPAVKTDIYYSDSVSVKTDDKTGEVYFELNKPSIWSISYDSYNSNDQNMLKNKYFIYSDGNRIFTTTTKNEGVLYYSKAHLWKINYGFGFYSLYKARPRNIYGEAEYVSSPNQDAYVEGWNETELLMYEYLGIPFENIRESGGMITGWYYGNEVSMRLINTLYKPKMVMIDGGIYVTDYGEGSPHLANNGFYVGVSSPGSTNQIGSKYSYAVFY